jgi:hypothetical protein
LRTYLALLGAAQKAFLANGGLNNPQNPADPYMTLTGYFNSLRELGGCRRIADDEVRSRLKDYGSRLRQGETSGLFAKRESLKLVELTSRISTAAVAKAKDRLVQAFLPKAECIDIALATNMISVGLDILRLGLMAVFGQPKTTAEYIQATSRVGREEGKPGLIVTMLNVHKPRDRSHYERFEAWHASFYIMLHSLAHLLITQVSLECGYSSSAIRERVYAGDAGYGILLYTGSPDSEGTLGGLVEIGRKIDQHLRNAIELGRLCSNDPVCAQHSAKQLLEERFLLGAACHGCLLISETSCERFNQYLDRSLVVATVGATGAEFFTDQDLALP